MAPQDHCVIRNIKNGCSNCQKQLEQLFVTKEKYDIRRREETTIEKDV